MARSRAFNLTAELNLRGPSNIGNVVSNIRRQLGNINANVNVVISANSVRNTTQLNTALQRLNATLVTTRNNVTAATNAFNHFNQTLTQFNRTANAQQINNVTRSVNNMGRSAQTASTQMEEFGRQSALAVRRFAAYSTVTSVIFGVTNAIKNGVTAFIDYDKELVRLQQVTGESAAGLKGLSSTITDLATKLGISSSELTTVSSTLAQAGLTARDTEKALKALALSSLAPSFDDMNKTVEGSIALMRQFGINAGDLDKALGSVNAVAARFAVEASDIITAIQRTGGVFATASKGVSEGTDALNEFISVFTSIRATTRESAETIATGLRTIFTRIQRESTVDALKGLGIELRNAEGKFVGAYEAVRRLSEGLSKIDPRSAEFAKISEELGGFRQIGKVIPLIQQFATSQEALKVAQKGQGSLARDSITAQLSLANQVSKVREEFLALFRDIGSSDTFQTIAKGALDLTSNLIKMADSIKGVLPVLTTMLAFRGAGALAQFGAGFVGGIRGGGRRANGGYIGAYASGGLVPGSGDGDTVPAMLTPGEFVIRKKAVETIGAGNLHKINKYDLGGPVEASGKTLSSTYRSLSKIVDPKETYRATVTPEPVPTDKVLKDMKSRKKNFPNMPNWKNFEYAVSKAYGIPSPRGGNYFLDYPDDKPPAEAKFLRIDEDYGTGAPAGGFIKGNNNETMLAKLVGSGLYKKNWRTVKTYYPQSISGFRELASGGKIQKFLEGGGVKEIATSQGKNIEDVILGFVKNLGGIDGVKGYLGIAKGDRELNGLFRKGGIGKNLSRAISLIDQARKAAEHQGTLKANAMAAAQQLAIVGFDPVGYSNNIFEKLSNTDSTINVRGILADYAEEAQGILNSVSGAVNTGARRLQSKAIFGGSKNLVFDFDDTLVSGADIYKPGTNEIDIPGYSDLNKVAASLAKGQLTELGQALKSILASNPDILDQMRIVTARPPSNSPLLANRLQKLGLNIPASKITGVSGSRNKPAAIGKNEKLIDDLYATVAAVRKGGGEAFPYSPLKNLTAQEEYVSNLAAAQGSVLQAVLGVLGARGGSIQNEDVDFKTGLGPQAASFFGVDPNIPTEVKRTLSSDTIYKAKQEFTKWFASNGMASGGSVQDTVPAMLTPGEFVINKNAASRLGSATLNKLNHADKISGFNKGGSVGGIQHFVTGGDVQLQAGEMLGASNIRGFASFFGSIDSQLNLTKTQVTELGNSLTTSSIKLTEWTALVNRGGNITLQAAQRAITADINRTRATDTSNNAANRIAAAERILTRTREVGTAATTRFRDMQQAQRDQTRMGAFGNFIGGQGAMFGSLALGALAGQGETLFGKATTSAGAGRIGGFEKATTTAATGLGTATSLVMIPGIGPYLAAIALVTTGLMTISSYFSGASEATKEFEQNLRTKGIENASDRTSKALTALEQNINNTSLQYKASQAIIAENALRQQDLTAKLEDVTSRANTWGEWFLGTAQSNKQQEKQKIVKDTAFGNQVQADQAQRLIETKLKSGMSIGQLQADPAFMSLVKTISRADQSFLMLETTMSAARIEEELKRRGLQIANSEVNKAIVKTIEQEKAMASAANAAHKAAMSLDEFSKGLSQGLDRASFELENLKAAEESAAQAISGEAKNRTSTSRNINILQNPSAYSAGERQQALNVATSTLSPANAQMQRTLSTLPNVLENALAANATQFNPSSTFDEKAESSAKTTMGDVIKNMPGLSDELKQNLQRKFDQEVAELAKKVNENNGTMDDFNAGLKTIVQNLINVDAIQKNNVTMLQLMDNAFNHFVEGLNNNAARLKKANDLMFKAVQIGINGFYALRKALTGVEMSIGEVKDMENRTLSRLTGGPTNTNQIYANIKRLMAEGASLETQSKEEKNRGDLQAAAQTEIKLKEVNDQLNNNRQALQHLAESTAVADAALRDIEKAKQIREAKTQYVEKIITSGPDQLTKMDRTVARLENNLAGRQNIGSFAAREAYQTTLEQTENPVEAMKAAREAMAQERSDTLALFKELRPINEYDLTQKLQQQINPNTGQNYTASEAEVEAIDRMNKQQAELMRQMAIESGTINRPIVQAQIRAVEQGLNSDQMVRKAQGEYIAAVNAQREATIALADQEMSLITSIHKLIVTLQENINNIGAQGNAGIENGAPQEGQPRPQRQAQVQPQADNQGRGDGRAGGLIILPAEARAAGGMINFTPRGTDTVPAMLTPGEFVVNRQSAQANMPLLRSINSSGGKAFSMGGVVYAADGWDGGQIPVQQAGGQIPNQQAETDPFIRDPKDPSRILRRKTRREITLEENRVAAHLPAQLPSIDPKTGALNYAGISGAQPLGMDKNGKPLNPEAVKRVNPLMYWRSQEGQSELRDLANSNPVAAARIVAQLDRATMMEARKQNTTPRAVNERKPLDQSPVAISVRRMRAAGFETSDEKKNRESRRAEGLATAAEREANDQVRRGKILARKQGIGNGLNEVSAVNQETGDLAYVDYSNLDAQDQEALRVYMDKQKMEWDKKEREKKDAEIVAKVKERQKTKDDAIAKAEEDKKRQEEKRLSERASGSDRYWASHPEEKAEADKKEAAYQEDLKKQQAQAQAARDAKRVADEKDAREAHIKYAKDNGMYHLTEEGKAEYDKRQEEEAAKKNTPEYIKGRADKLFAEFLAKEGIVKSSNGSTDWGFETRAREEYATLEMPSTWDYGTVENLVRGAINRAKEREESRLRGIADKREREKAESAAFKTEISSAVQNKDTIGRTLDEANQIGELGEYLAPEIELNSDGTAVQESILYAGTKGLVRSGFQFAETAINAPFDPSTYATLPLMAAFGLSGPAGVKAGSGRRGVSVRRPTTPKPPTSAVRLIRQNADEAADEAYYAALRKTDDEMYAAAAARNLQAEDAIAARNFDNIAREEAENQQLKNLQELTDEMYDNDFPNMPTTPTTPTSVRPKPPVRAPQTPTSTTPPSPKPPASSRVSAAIRAATQHVDDQSAKEVTKALAAGEVPRNPGYIKRLLSGNIDTAAKNAATGIGRGARFVGGGALKAVTPSTVITAGVAAGAGYGASRYIDQATKEIENLEKAQLKSSGGLVYASHGMMVPKGTDTIPAMLTSGEFVVNRDSAQKNLGLLNSINRSRGGVVPSYYQHGGAVDIDGGAAAAKPAGGGAFTLPPEMAALVTDLNKAFGGFGKYVEQLSKVSLPNEITFNHTGTVDVRITGAEALNAFREETRIIVDSAVSKAMRGINLQTEGGVGAPAGNPKTTGE